MQKVLILHFHLYYHSPHYFEEKELAMEFLALLSVLVLGMVLGWMLAQDSKKRLVIQLVVEKQKVQDLQLSLAKEKAKGLRWEKVREIGLG